MTVDRGDIHTPNLDPAPNPLPNLNPPPNPSLLVRTIAAPSFPLNA
jgi:hypothetical protein